MILKAVTGSLLVPLVLAPFKPLLTGQYCPLYRHIASKSSVSKMYSKQHYGAV
ncbi:hypothetical protein PI125_g9162 [Phytophthora idaei]|nr:hypothetical protein PI125_g9162 [Phytophthora idaei]KAG3161983.1 hypothetical protein PI126_g6189 [Phytophthora idaei]